MNIVFGKKYHVFGLQYHFIPSNGKIILKTRSARTIPNNLYQNYLHNNLIILESSFYNWRLI